LKDELKRLAADVTENPVSQKVVATVMTIGGATQVFNWISAIIGALVGISIIYKNISAGRKNNIMAKSIERQEAEVEERKEKDLPLRRKEDECEK
jgi:hypothetical protein